MEHKIDGHCYVCHRPISFIRWWDILRYILGYYHAPCDECKKPICAEHSIWVYDWKKHKTIRICERCYHENKREAFSAPMLPIIESALAKKTREQAEQEQLDEEEADFQKYVSPSMSRKCASCGKSFSMSQFGNTFRRDPNRCQQCNQEICPTCVAESGIKTDLHTVECGPCLEKRSRPKHMRRRR